MGEPKMGFFAKIYYSVVSFDKYKYFLRQSTARAVLHVLIIALVCCIITFIPLVNDYNKIVDEIIVKVDTTAPDFKFADGKLEIAGDMPIILEDGNITIIIDTSPNAEDTILDSYDKLILITSDKIIQKNYVDRTYTSFDVFRELKLTKDNLKEVLPLMKPLGIPVFIFIGILLVCWSLITIFIVSIIALIINSSKGTNLSYRSIYKISAYALTLPLIAITFLGLLPINFLFLRLLYYAIAAVYVFGSINSIKSNLDTYGNNLSE